MKTAGAHPAAEPSLAAFEDELAERRRRAVELRATGLSFAKIGAEMGVSHETARRWVHDSGVVERCASCGEPMARATSERVCDKCTRPLRRYRKARGMTQLELANRVGCRPNTISELELPTGLCYHPALKLAERIAAVLDADVVDLFPDLQITSAEAGTLLRMTLRDVTRLCTDGELPASREGHWWRLDYAAVLQLAAEREERRRNWISFHAIERKYGVPWWVLRQWQEAGTIDVIVGDRRGTNLVELDKVEAVLAEARRQRRRVRCPYCRKPVKLGRKAHAQCLGALGSRNYWLDPDESAERRRAHGEKMREIVRAAWRSPRRVYQGVLKTRAAKSRWSGRWSPSSGRPRGYTDEQAEKVRQLRTTLTGRRGSIRAIARQLDLTKWQVESILASNCPET